LTTEEIKIRVDERLLECAIAQEEMTFEAAVEAIRRRPRIKTQEEQRRLKDDARRATGNALKARGGRRREINRRCTRFPVLTGRHPKTGRLKK
jgi:hypothetical protein